MTALRCWCLLLVVRGLSEVDPRIENRVKVGLAGKTGPGRHPAIARALFPIDIGQSQHGHLLVEVSVLECASDDVLAETRKCPTRRRAAKRRNQVRAPLPGLIEG